MNRLIFISLLSLFLFVDCDDHLQPMLAEIKIDTKKGHAISRGASGFNVRIADKIWDYNHPDFVAGIDSLKPGWLRYFSGTMGDAFNSATGQYDYDYAWQFDHQDQYLKGYKFTEIKGPHRVYDLYQLLGRVGGKLVITVNGFTETPEIVGQLARFCKNNHIIVEAWQFCNEPYFYVPNRDRYWWNDGYDYAEKMKPFADSIRAVFPEAKLALNYTWDGVWQFMKGIHRYQEEKGRYWNVFSKHSYAPHTGQKESLDSAYRRANTRLPQVTGADAMSQIEDYTWLGAPLLITEFGVWNRPLNGIYTAIYDVEYTLRQLQHANAFLIGSHEVSSKVVPTERQAKLVRKVFDSGKKIHTDSVRTGFHLSDEGKSNYLMLQATNQSDFIYSTELIGGPEVPAKNGEMTQGWFASSFQGVDGFDYLVVTNRSEQAMDLRIIRDEQPFSTQFSVMKIKAHGLKEPVSNIISYQTDDLLIDPFSVFLISWKVKDQVPPSTRIYQSEIVQDGIRLKWWKSKTADKYVVRITGQSEERITEVKDDTNELTVAGLVPGRSYTFSLTAENDIGQSERSNQVTHDYSLPGPPTVFITSARFKTATVYWKSVKNASGYRVHVVSGRAKKIYDAKNTFGFKIGELKYDSLYRVRVTAYNELGESKPSGEVTIMPVKNKPRPARNLSAKETFHGRVKLNWVSQDTPDSDVTYNIYRGNEIYGHKLIAANVEGDSYEDILSEKEETYYYTVKSVIDTVETNYPSNIATVIPIESLIRLEVINIEESETAYKVTIAHRNFPTDGDTYFGAAISNLSYLNQAEERLLANEIGEDRYQVSIPKTKIKDGATYSVRAVIISNGSPQYSSPPHKKINDGKIAG